MPTEPGRLGELEDAIDGVLASYTGELAIDGLGSASLPDKRAVIEAFEHLRHALFVGFFSPRPVTPGSLRAALAEHLHAAYRGLVEQVDRALTYETWRKGAVETAPLRTGSEVVLGLVRALPELRRLLDADVRAAFEGDPAAKTLEEIVLSYPSLEAIVAYRVANRLARAGVPVIPRIITEHAHSRTGIDINPGATIGERFFIDHGTGVVIGETTRIGDGVKLYQGVTLGALSVADREEQGKRHPTLEDGVTIYAGATILGGDTVIGRGSVVGGNVWLTRSVAPGSRVFGRARGADE